MDIYQCMTCGERWAHGSEDAVQAAARHQGQGHAVYIGNIDQLAKQYTAQQNGAPSTVVPERSDPLDPESRLGGKVDIWGPNSSPAIGSPTILTPAPTIEKQSIDQDSPGIFVVRQFRQWLCSEENDLGFEHEVGRYLSAQAWRYLAAMIDKVHGLPR